MSFVARSVVHGLAARSAFNGSWTGAWQTHGSTKGSLTPQLRNGNCPLGTLDAPQLPPHLGTAPWGNYDPHAPITVPDTGVTRHYDFTLSYQDIAPDGVTKQGIVVNGQYPGPTIEANWGDWIEVTVHNSLGANNEGTAMHWHGMLQKESPWMDGVPGVQQCPIVPGDSFTYRFRADLFGTSWYHSHYSAQYSGGAAGPMIIYGPDSHGYDIDLGPVMMSDWYHDSYYDLVEEVMKPAPDANTPNPPPFSDNNIINGFGEFDCTKTDKPCVPDAGVAKFKFTSGKKHRLRLINPGSEGVQKFSIDGHRMTVIAHDFVQVNPYEVTALTLGVGQRADVIVEATGKPTDAYWMRAELGAGGALTCNVNNVNASEALAVVYYDKADPAAVPTSSPQPDKDLTACTNEPLTITTPLVPIPAVESPAVTQQLDIDFKYNGTHHLWHFGENTYRADYNDALLYQFMKGNPTPGPLSNIYDYGSNTSVRFVIYNRFGAPHPLHQHGHEFKVLNEGYGTWDGTIVNPSNPQRRDVQLMPAAKTDGTPSFVVLEITMDNPGLWPFHCHIAWHVSGGLYLNVLERPDDITHLQIPDSIAQTCKAWDAYTAAHAPDQIDSGLRKKTTSVVRH